MLPNINLAVSEFNISSKMVTAPKLYSYIDWLGAITALLLHIVGPVCLQNTPLPRVFWYYDNSSRMCLYITGFLGVDCSVNATIPPTIIGIRLPGTVCDVRGQTSCAAVSLFVTGFSFSESFTCRMVSTAPTSWIQQNCIIIMFRELSL